MNAAGPVILIAEDDDGHARLAQLELEEAIPLGRILRFRNGLETWEYLSAGNDCASPRSGLGLLLLDIQLPGLGGIELLRRIRADQRYNDVPVVMLSTSDSPAEIRSCYKLGCDNYLLKPLDAQKTASLLRFTGRPAPGSAPVPVSRPG